MSGAGYVSDKDFGSCDIYVANRGGGHHIKVAGTRVDNGVVGYLVGGLAGGRMGLLLG